MTAPVGEPPLDAYPPDAPATVEDVRATRRWVWVAGVWAVAASAIAVLALIQANKHHTNNNQPTTTTPSVSAQQLDSYQKQTNARLDALSRRLNDTAAAADLQKLDKRVTQDEKNASKAQQTETTQTQTITTMQSDIKDLQKRVQNLENQQQNQNQNQTNTGTTTSP